MPAAPGAVPGAASASAAAGAAAAGANAATYHPANADAVRDVAFDPFRPLSFASAWEDGSLQVWDVRSVHAPVHRFTAHAGLVMCLHWHPTRPGILASGGRDRLLKIWSIEDRGDVASAVDGRSFLSACAAALNGTTGGGTKGADEEDSLLSTVAPAEGGGAAAVSSSKILGSSGSSSGVRHLLGVQTVASVGHVAWRSLVPSFPAGAALPVPDMEHGAAGESDREEEDEAKGAGDEDGTHGGSGLYAPPVLQWKGKRRRCGAAAAGIHAGRDARPRKGEGSKHTEAGKGRRQNESQRRFLEALDTPFYRYIASSTDFHIASVPALLDPNCYVWDLRHPTLPVAIYGAGGAGNEDGYGHSDVITGLTWVRPPLQQLSKNVSSLPGSKETEATLLACMPWLLTAGKDGNVFLQKPSMASRPHLYLRTANAALSFSNLASSYQPIDREAFWDVRDTLSTIAPPESQLEPSGAAPAGPQGKRDISSSVLETPKGAKATATVSSAKAGAAKGDASDAYVAGTDEKACGGSGRPEFRVLSADDVEKSTTHALPTTGAGGDDLVLNTEAPVSAFNSFFATAQPDASRLARASSVFEPSSRVFALLSINYKMEGGTVEELCAYNGEVAFELGLYEVGHVWRTLGALFGAVPDLALRPLPAPLARKLEAEKQAKVKVEKAKKEKEERAAKKALDEKEAAARSAAGSAPVALPLVAASTQSDVISKMTESTDLSNKATKQKEAKADSDRKQERPATSTNFDKVAIASASSSASASKDTNAAGEKAERKEKSALESTGERKRLVSATDRTTDAASSGDNETVAEDETTDATPDTSDEDAHTNTESDDEDEDGVVEDAADVPLSPRTGREGQNQSEDEIRAIGPLSDLDDASSCGSLFDTRKDKSYRNTRNAHTSAGIVPILSSIPAPIKSLLAKTTDAAQQLTSGAAGVKAIPGYVPGLLESLAAVNPFGASSAVFEQRPADATDSDEDSVTTGASSNDKTAIVTADTAKGKVDPAVGGVAVEDAFGKLAPAGAQGSAIASTKGPSDGKKSGSTLTGASTAVTGSVAGAAAEDAKASSSIATKPTGVDSGMQTSASGAITAAMKLGDASAASTSAAELNGVLVGESWKQFCIETALDVLQFYAQMGDIQTCVTVSRVLGPEVEARLGKRTIQRWYFSYIDLLHRLQMWAAASTVMARCSDEGIRRLNQMHTAIPSACAQCGSDSKADIPSVPCHLHPECSSRSKLLHANEHAAEELEDDLDHESSNGDSGRCKYRWQAPAEDEEEKAMAMFGGGDANANKGAIPHLPPDAIVPISTRRCGECRTPASLCAVCLEPARGLFVWCQGCGHGGHLQHMREWFVEKKATLCPTGCMHACNLQFQ
jgi:hypothetical protein